MLHGPVFAVLEMSGAVTGLDARTGDADRNEPAGNRVVRPHRTTRYRVETRLSVILPFYNEGDLVPRLIGIILDFARAHPECRFVLVDDGSTDKTALLLQSQIEEACDRDVILLVFPRNRGKGYAVRSAIVLCAGDFVCFADGDLAYSLDHLFSLEEAMKTHDIAIGSRALCRPLEGIRPIRRLLGWTFNALVRTMLGLPHRDTQAGLKGFRASVAAHLFSLQRIDGLGFDAELLFLARKHGYSVAEIPARVGSEHVYKTAKAKLVKNSLRMMLDVFKIRIYNLIGCYR